MLEEIGLAIAGLGGAAVLALKLLPKKVRVIEWTNGFVRITPNPGVKIGNFHMCTNKNCGRWSKG